MRRPPTSGNVKTLHGEVVARVLEVLGRWLMRSLTGVNGGRGSCGAARGLIKGRKPVRTEASRTTGCCTVDGGACSSDEYHNSNTAKRVTGPPHRGGAKGMCAVCGQAPRLNQLTGTHHQPHAFGTTL